MVGSALILFIFFVCFACRRSCCRMCKLDFTRTDYRKHEKIIPGIWFLNFNVFALVLVGLALYQFTNMWFFFANTFCLALDFVNTLKVQSQISLAFYTKALNFLDVIYEPILYITLTFIFLLTVCYLMGLLVICCVMVTKKRSCKNISHIAWISGISTLLVAALIGCMTAFGGLQVWDACQVNAYSQTQGSVTGLNNFYPVAIQPMINDCIFGQAL